MGEVWRAIDDVLARDVAVKVLRPEYAADEDFLARFRAEARNAAMLSHHGIARVYDYGEDDCCPYLVMELVPGEPISALLRREGRLPVDLALGVVAQVGAALGAAHAAGVVHRDVKPANLILTPEGTVKITDFGIARALGAPALTRTGEVMGTASYLAPEQVSGGRGTAASDVYSLGVVAYECLSGVRPFRDQDPLAIAVAHLKEEPPPLPEEIPEAARDLVLSALAKDPGDRPAGAVSSRARRRRSGGGCGLRILPAAGRVAGCSTFPARRRDGTRARSPDQPLTRAPSPSPRPTWPARRSPTRRLRGRGRGRPSSSRRSWCSSSPHCCRSPPRTRWLAKIRPRPRVRAPRRRLPPQHPRTLFRPRPRRAPRRIRPLPLPLSPRAHPRRPRASQSSWMRRAMSVAMHPWSRPH